MNSVLRKRLLRELRTNFGRYLALILLIILGIYIVVSIVGAADMVIVGTEKQKDVNMLEDGDFTVLVSLTNKDLDEITEDGTDVEKIFSIDIKAEDNSTLRLFKNRERIDLIQLDEGRLADKNNEAVLEKGYANAHKLSVGDSINVAGIEFKIVGTGSVPDYEQVLATFSDTAVENNSFGLIFTTDEQYESIKDKNISTAEEYTYAYRLGNITDSELKDKIKALDFDYYKINNKYFKESIEPVLEKKNKLEQAVSQLPDSFAELRKSIRELSDEAFDIDIDNLTSFVTAEDNIRIGAASADVVVDKNAGLVAGVIVLIMFTYVISVFVIHQIEREQSVIGALYALGVKKKNLLLHYITIPTLLAFAGGIIGALIGFSSLGVNIQAQETYDYFSLPKFDTVYPVYLILYAVVLPPLISAAVNALVINKKLSQTALSLIKNEQSGTSYKQFDLKTKNFERLFQIRQMVRESRSAVTMFFGMLVSMLVLTLSFNIYIGCKNVKISNVNDTKYEYMYQYKYPEKNVPKNAEEAYVENLSIDCYGYALDVSVIGIGKDNKFFSAKPSKGKNKAVINNALVERYGLKKGDKFTLTDSVNDTDYTFTVDDTVQYNPGFTIFMDIDSMRELFDKDEDYFNAVYSDSELDIDSGRLYSVISREDVERSSAVFVDKMMPMIRILLIASAAIFCVVMYLMMGVMIDRSAMGISLIKIFGYRSKEIRKLYLNGNFIVVAIGGLICIPIAKVIIDKIYPMLVANIACSMKLDYPIYLYIGIYAGILFVYFAVNRILIGKINKISPVDVLKNRE